MVWFSRRSLGILSHRLESALVRPSGNTQSGFWQREAGAQVRSLNGRYSNEIVWFRGSYEILKPATGNQHQRIGSIIGLDQNE